MPFSYRLYLHYVKIVRFSAIYITSYNSNSGNYLHLSVVVHYKTVLNNNVLSVNFLCQCHHIGTIKPSLHLTLPDTFIFNFLLFPIFIENKFLSGAIKKVRQKAGLNVTKYAPYHLHH